jgi:hypothetical protein
MITLNEAYRNLSLEPLVGFQITHCTERGFRNWTRITADSLRTVFTLVNFTKSFKLSKKFYGFYKLGSYEIALSGAAREM